MTHPFVIREINQLNEMLELEQFQKEIWGVEDREVFPALAMVPLKEVGGVIIGAFEAERLIGFVLGFPGFEAGHCTLHSDMLAVRPEYRSAGLGRQLKLNQRAKAIEKGIDTITWTFDPLQSLNAHFNFRKLGVTSRRYLPNFYGETTSFLHSTGTDRLWVSWDLKSEHVIDRINNARLEGPPADVPVVLQVGEEGTKPVRMAERLSQRKFVDIPANINELAVNDLPLARLWREATREIFVEAMAGGFVVEDFFLIEENKRKFGRYLLTSSRE